MHSVFYVGNICLHKLSLLMKFILHNNLDISTTSNYSDFIGNRTLQFHASFIVEELCINKLINNKKNIEQEMRNPKYISVISHYW